jgi:hypothetical protein
MSLQGPIVVVAEWPAADLGAVLRAHGAFPVIEASWHDAAAAVASIKPAAVIIADPDAPGDAQFATALAQAIADLGGVLLPVMARVIDGAVPAIAHALPFPVEAPPARMAARLASALRVRTLHATVLGRREMAAARGETVPAIPCGDPLDDATVLLMGRGRSYPALSVAIAERVGLIGALGVETAVRTLNGRAIDGVVIGDGFGPGLVEALLTVIADDLRFRDLPVVVCTFPKLVEDFAGQMPNLDYVGEGAERVLARLLPLLRLRAFEARLKRVLQSLDAAGMTDPTTGLLTREAFWRDLERAVRDAEERGVGLSIARLAFEPRLDARSAADAARLVTRLVRDVDFACREADDSIYAVFTETDLRTAHVIARRLAAVLKHTMLAPDHDRSRLDPHVTLATLKSNDTFDSLVARVCGSPVVAAG